MAYCCAVLYCTVLYAPVEGTALNCIELNGTARTTLHYCAVRYCAVLSCRGDRFQRVYRDFSSLVRRRQVQPRADAYTLPFRAHGKRRILSFDCSRPTRSSWKGVSSTKPWIVMLLYCVMRGPSQKRRGCFLNDKDVMLMSCWCWGTHTQHIDVDIFLDI